MLAFETLAEHEGVLGADGNNERGTETEALEEGQKDGHVHPILTPLHIFSVCNGSAFATPTGEAS
jgi:hypothetical protein